MENPIKMDDLGVPQFLETPICIISFSSLIATVRLVARDFFSPPNQQGKAWRDWSWSDILVDGSEILLSPVKVGSLSHYLQGFLHPRWCRISEPSTVSTVSIEVFKRCNKMRVIELHLSLLGAPTWGQTYRRCRLATTYCSTL